jgi:hypothetical protein
MTDEQLNGTYRVETRILRRTGLTRGELLPGDVVTGHLLHDMGLDAPHLIAIDALVAVDGLPTQSEPRPFGTDERIAKTTKLLGRAGYGPAHYATLTNEQLAGVYGLDGAAQREFRQLYPNPATLAPAPAPAPAPIPVPAPEPPVVETATDTGEGGGRKTRNG